MGLKAGSVPTPDAPSTSNPRTDDIHLWQNHGRSNAVWKGFFHSVEAGLAWIREHPGDYTLNNVPPPTSNSNRQPVRGEVGPKPKPRDATPFKRAPRPAATVKTFKPKKTEAEKQFEKQAQQRLDKHRTDEAAELDAG